MKYLLPFLPALFAIFSPLHGEEPPIAKPEDAPRKWKWLGDDESLRQTIATSDQVLFVCVYQTALENAKPPFAWVVLSATVVEALKGSHSTGDKVTIRFPTDDLPKDEGEREKFIAAAAEKNLGSLKIAYLKGKKSAAHSCEWLDLAPHTPEMAAFVKANRDVKPENAPEKEAQQPTLRPIHGE